MRLGTGSYRVAFEDEDESLSKGVDFVIKVSDAEVSISPLGPEYKPNDRPPGSLLLRKRTDGWVELKVFDSRVSRPSTDPTDPAYSIDEFWRLRLDWRDRD